MPRFTQWTAIITCNDQIVARHEPKSLTALMQAIQPDIRSLSVCEELIVVIKKEKKVKS